MAPKNQDIPSFDDMIQADRLRRKNEELANEIFGRGRKEKSNGNSMRNFGRGRKEKSNGNSMRNFGSGPSLASRVGIAKASQRSKSNTPISRSANVSRSDIGAAWLHDLHKPENGIPRGPKPSRQNPMSDKMKDDLLAEALTAKGARNHARTRIAGPEISIRGIAGPYVVVASNFAPGTTAADIESAMVPSGGELQSCRIITAAPTVIAEMVFGEKRNAEAVIDTFNNKKADGRILHVYMKTGGPTPVAGVSTSQRPAAETVSSTIDLTRDDPAASYRAQREAADQDRRRAEPDVQDGRFGFEKKEDQMEVDDDAAPQEKKEGSRRHERQDDYYDSRPRGPRDSGFDSSRQRGPRGTGYYERGYEPDRPRNDRRLYSDGMYNRSHGSGYR